jgi:GDPmannose 4,6-dehydratase
MATALITGITGQDGSYLAEWLIGRGYDVHGLVWPPVAIEQSWLAPLQKLIGSRLFLRPGDIREAGLFPETIKAIAPDEIYHLAGQTHVVDSFNDPEAGLDLNARSVVRLLEAVRREAPRARVFHASSSEIFGAPQETPQTEETPVNPINPYACAKAFSTQMVRVYRRTYGVFGVNGILYAHESPRRGQQFMTRTVCRAAATIKAGRACELKLGDLDALRDWTHARDMVRGMWLSLQHTVPEDFVFASGHLHSVREFVTAAFGQMGMDWQPHVQHDGGYSRPVDGRRMVGNAAKARRLLGWEPRITFSELVAEMVQAEVERLQTG